MKKFIIYTVYNLKTDKVYVGKTKNSLKRRKYLHYYSALKKGSKTPFHNALRKYREKDFIWDIDIITTEDKVNEVEKLIISSWDSDQLYNIAKGGEGGFVIRDKERWKEKLSRSRKGKKPALGMRHTQENKEYFSKVSREYWEKNKTYDKQEVLKYSFKEANEIFGISKTHYYRLKNDTL